MAGLVTGRDPGRPQLLEKAVPTRGQAAQPPRARNDLNSDSGDGSSRRLTFSSPPRISAAPQDASGAASSLPSGHSFNANPNAPFKIGQRSILGTFLGG
jgi:hypothetical protein